VFGKQILICISMLHSQNAGNNNQKFTTETRNISYEKAFLHNTHLGLDEDVGAHGSGIADGLGRAAQQRLVGDHGAVRGVDAVHHNAVHLGVLKEK